MLLVRLRCLSSSGSCAQLFAPLFVTARSASGSSRGRSLSPDDPFGEESSREDPGSFLHTFKKFDEAAFDTATSSAEVQNAHFGPAWARFSTVGRMASAAMTENKPSASPRTAEELHEESLQRKKQMMAKNYESYEDFVSNELGGTKKDGADDTAAPILPSAYVGDIARHAALGDIGDRFRLNQIERNQERLREASTEDGGVVENEDCRRVDDEDGDDGLASSVPLPSFYQAAEASTAEDAPSGANTCSTEDNDGVARVIPDVDPQHWTTAQVVLWLRTVGEEGAMDESMQQAFEMMRVDGAMLLKKVSPNTLFKSMRRWQLKRKALLAKGVSDAEAMAELAGEFRGAVNITLVQETIYLCYPYGMF